MANVSDVQRMHALRERSERNSLAQVAGLSRGSSWLDIGATGLADEKRQKFLEDSEWFYARDEVDEDRELCDGFGFYSTEPRSATHSDDKYYTPYFL